MNYSFFFNVPTNKGSVSNFMKLRTIYKTVYKNI